MFCWLTVKLLARIKNFGCKLTGKLMCFLTIPFYIFFYGKVHIKFIYFIVLRLFQQQVTNKTHFNKSLWLFSCFIAEYTRRKENKNLYKLKDEIQYSLDNSYRRSLQQYIFYWNWFLSNIPIWTKKISIWMPSSKEAMTINYFSYMYVLYRYTKLYNKIVCF